MEINSDILLNEKIQSKVIPLKKILKENNTHHEIVGTVQKEFFEIKGEMKINVKDLYTANSKWYSNYNGINN